MCVRFLTRSLGADGYQVTALESGAGIESVMSRPARSTW